MYIYIGKKYGQHGKAGHDEYHALLAEGKPEEVLQMPYFQDTLQHEMYSQHGKAGHYEYHALLAEGKQEEASQLPYLQDTLQYEMYGRQGKAGYDEFKELVDNDKLCMARDTPHYQDTWQYGTYDSGGHAKFKETTAKLREYASEILTVQWDGDNSNVQTMWTCTASGCASKGRWCGRKDKFTAHQKTHTGGNATFVKSVNRTKKGAILGNCSLCTSAPMMLMKTWRMKRHLTQTFSQVFLSEGE